MYENDNYIGMVIKIETSHNFSTFCHSATGEKKKLNLKSVEMGQELRVKMPQKFIDLKCDSESLLRVRNTDEEKHSKSGNNGFDCSD